jgi:hypothetical protein
MITKCVDRYKPGWADVSPGGTTMFMSALDTLFAQYTSPGLPFTVDESGNILYLRCPLPAPDGSGQGTDCVTSGQSDNPWSGQPVVDLDSLSNQWIPGAPRPRAAPLGPRPQSGGGGGGAGGEPTIGGDCSVCLMMADCTGLTTQECETQHCAAYCPWDSSLGDVPECSGDLGSGGSPTVLQPACAGSGEGCDAQMLCCDGYACMASGVCG